MVDKTPPNFLINGARNNKRLMQTFMSTSAVYLAILRNPIEHFRAVYYFTDVSYFMGKMSNGRRNAEEMFEDFSHNPMQHINAIINSTNEFQPKFHLLKNGSLSMRHPFSRHFLFRIRWN